MIFNCSHPSTKQLTVERVNTATGYILTPFLNNVMNSGMDILDCSYNGSGHYYGKFEELTKDTTLYRNAVHGLRTCVTVRMITYGNVK